MGKVQLRRGFKAEANWYANQLRSELGLTPSAPLCPWRLAEHLDLEVIEISRFLKEVPEAVAYLHSNVGKSEFSALTIPVEGRHLIIHNDNHDSKRQAANLAHEIAHCVLIHKFSPLIGISGERNFDSEIEEEANWLGPTLLVSDQAALDIAGRMADQGLTILRACDEFGVSSQLMRMRLQVSGALKRIERRRAA